VHRWTQSQGWAGGEARARRRDDAGSVAREGDAIAADGLDDDVALASRRHFDRVVVELGAGEVQALWLHDVRDRCQLHRPATTARSDQGSVLLEDLAHPTADSPEACHANS
jgi:hypothetical protein